MLSHFKSFKMFVSDLPSFGAGFGWLDRVGRRKKLREKHGTSVNGRHDKKSPTAESKRREEQQSAP
jgi:hypothetical protein